MERRFTADEAATTLGVSAGQLMKLIAAGEISYIRVDDRTIEFEQQDFDKFQERKAERAALSKILARGPSGAKEWALYNRHLLAEADKRSDEQAHTRKPRRRPKAPTGCYWRGPVLWGAVKVRGRKFAWSLHTADPETAALRREARARTLREPPDAEEAKRRILAGETLTPKQTDLVVTAIDLAMAHGLGAPK
jgi:excisionase family DNA binding protein